MAGVDMRLEPNAYRELHWHKANEWSLILNGTVRLNAVNEAGQTFVDDLGPGDVWYFPAGIPHSSSSTKLIDAWMHWLTRIFVDLSPSFRKWS